MPSSRKASPPAPPKTSRSAATRQRIVQRSIQLFNRQGLRNVAIEQISASLKISPGNFTYHFPRKKDLIAECLGVLKERMMTALEPPAEVRTADDGARYLLRIYSTLWEFRFFFNALTYALTLPGIHEEYREFHEWSLDAIERDLAMFRQQKKMVPVRAPNSARLLAENMWSLWLNWLRAEQIRSPSAVRPGQRALFDCAIHHWSLSEPWMQPAYARDLLEALCRQLPEAAKQRGMTAAG